jgi:hypothetical protein
MGHQGVSSYSIRSDSSPASIVGTHQDSRPYYFLDLTSFVRALQPHLGAVLGILGRSISFLPSSMLSEDIHFEDVPG